MASPKSSKRLLLASRLLIAAAIILAVIGGILAWHQHRQNEAADNKAAAAQARANNGHATGSNPSTEKPSWDSFESYKVPADHPKYIMIPKIGVDARVKTVGLTSGGAVGSPTNVYDTAWYTGSALPGQKGATFIDGHVSSWTTNGVFYNLKNLQPGDKIEIVLGNDKKIYYKVVKKQIYKSDKVDMKKILAPINSKKSGLSLMTCTGQVEPGTSEFDQRVAVFAEQTS